jgi:hypothetical protein
MMIVGIVVVLRSVSRFPAVLVYFQSHMHVRVEQKNEVRSQSKGAAQTQPNRFVFCRSHNWFARTARIIGLCRSHASFLYPLRKPLQLPLREGSFDWLAPIPRNGWINMRSIRSSFGSRNC